MRSRAACAVQTETQRRELHAEDARSCGERRQRAERFVVAHADDSEDLGERVGDRQIEGEARVVEFALVDVAQVVERVEPVHQVLAEREVDEQRRQRDCGRPRDEGAIGRGHESFGRRARPGGRGAAPLPR